MPDAARPPGRSFWSLVAGVAVARVLLALAVHPAYGLHRDELLYLAMADHLDLWRMQFPPFIAIVGRAALAVPDVAAQSAARILAALAGTALTAVALLIAHRLGGRAIALGLTALALLAAPVFVRPAVLLQPVIFDQLWFAVAALGLLMAAQGTVARGWMIVGVGAGLGGLTKFSVGFYLVGITAAVLLTSGLRAQLRTRWPWIAATLAGLVALPALTGQAAHGWPFLAQMRELSGGQLARVSWGEYLVEQPLMLGAASLFALLGAASLARDAAARPARPLGVAALTVVLLLGLMHGKAYYAAPVYVPLVAVGGVALERLAHRRRWVVPAAGIGTAIAALALLPAGAPILAPEPMARYATRLGLTETNDGSRLPLPQDYADMTGWREQAAATAAAWHALPAAERADAAILAINYGRAGALARYGAEYGLPYPRSLHGDFWAWGPGPAATTVLVLGAEPEQIAAFCDEAVEVGRVRNPLGVEEEQDVPISICRASRPPLPILWRRLGPQWG